MRFLAFVLPLGVVATAWAVLAPRLPPVVATHFAADGTANGWMTLGSAFAFQGLLFTLLGAVFTLIVPAFARRSPELVNIPHRDYWLAPDRIDEGVAKLGTWLAVFWLVFGTGIAGVGAFALSVNVGPEPHTLPTNLFVAQIGALLAFAVGWAVAMNRAFQRPA